MDENIKIGNPELLKLAMKTIEVDLSRWNQMKYCDWGSTTIEDWDVYAYDKNALVDVEACGTTFCLAGQAALLAGHLPLKSGAWKTPEGRTDSAHELAQKALGLDYDQADALFYRTSDGNDLWLNGNNPGAWEYYKSFVTSVTGVEFD